MKAAIALLLLLLLLLPAAGLTVTADDTPGPAVDPVPVAENVDGAPAVQPQAALPSAGLADIPENAAEREASERGESSPATTASAAPAAAADAARAARRAAFDAVIAEQDARIEALAARLTGTDGEQALALQKQIEQEKLTAGRRLLELQLEFAQADGDPERVERVRSALAAWDAPAPTGTPVERTSPGNPNR